MTVSIAISLAILYGGYLTQSISMAVSGLGEIASGAIQVNAHILMVLVYIGIWMASLIAVLILPKRVSNKERIIGLMTMAFICRLCRLFPCLLRIVSCQLCCRWA